MSRISCTVLTGIALASCATQPVAVPVVPAVARSEPQCALKTFPTNDRVGAWSVDKFAGRYSGPAGSLTVRREEHRLLVESAALGTRELTAPDVGSWTWSDGCGLRYDFTLPPDGPGAWLKITTPDGAVSQWSRAP